MKKIPEHFCTSVRKVEPVGGGCIRIYYAIERNGKWEDRYTTLVPIQTAIANARFVFQAATEIFNESDVAGEGERVH